MSSKLDARSSLLDARRTAEAVRGLLDEALAVVVVGEQASAEALQASTA